MSQRLQRRHVKRWSIVPVVTFDLLAAIGAAIVALTGRGGVQAIAWFGAAVATASLPVQLVSLLGLRKARTSRNLTVMTLIASIGRRRHVPT